MTERPTPPAAVLFDADGVLQYPPPAWRDLVAAARPGFFDRLLAVEADFLVGRRPEQEWLGVLDELVLAEGMTRAAFLEAWLAFRPHPAALAVVRDVRAGGIRTVLATNQQAYRARMMHEQGFYDAVMDDQYFSYQVGVKKPAAAYFEAILAGTGLAAGDVLFVDDVAENVEAARALGLRARHKPDTEGPDVLRALLVEEGALRA